MTRKPDPYDELRQRARDAGQPLRIRDLVATWAGQNEDTLIRAAIDALREPAGTKIVIPPLSVIAFPTITDKDDYYAALFEEVKKTMKGQTTSHKVLLLHVQKFTAWCRRELEEQFAEIVKLELAYRSQGASALIAEANEVQQ